MGFIIGSIPNGFGAFPEAAAQGLVGALLLVLELVEGLLAGKEGALDGVGAVVEGDGAGGLAGFGAAALTRKRVAFGTIP